MMKTRFKSIHELVSITQLASVRESFQTNFYHVTPYCVTTSQQPSIALHHLLNKPESSYHGQRFLELDLSLSPFIV